MQDITRRAALKGTAAVAAVAAVPTAASANDAHLRALYDEWDALWKYSAEVRPVTDEQLDLKLDRLTDLEHAIAETQAQSMNGVLVKLRVHMRSEGSEDTWPCAPDGRLCLDHIQVPSAWRDLERLVGEVSS